MRVISIAIGVGVFTFFILSNGFINKHIELKHKKVSFTSLQQKAAVAKTYCKSKGMSTEFCFLLDMSVHSGYNRFIVWDFKKDTIADQGLVAHGCGEKAWGQDETADAPIFSNISESHLSSIGKYAVTSRGYSNWGINVNYKLKGLESTNSKAYERTIVLHSWVDIPASECYPDGTPEGWGCPAVSNAFMKRIDAKLKSKKKNVLLWMYQ
ncbi:MAG: hypothetical protein ACI8Q1_001911 [Parvicella sp.]|jgi:hypothetical protein